jgi:hypothetical protein
LKLQAVWQFLRDLGDAFRSRSTEYAEFELREMENIFALLLVGSFIGIPSPPSSISVRLLPHIVREMYVMGSRARDLSDISGEVFGLFAE